MSRVTVTGDFGGFLNMKRTLLMAASAAVLAAPTIAQELPPGNPLPGECFARVIVPAQYQTSTEQVVLRQAGEEIKKIDAQLETVTERVLVQEESYELLNSPKCGAESLYIFSASIGPYLRAWASSCGVHEQNVMSTELSVDNNRITEGLFGYNVWGSNKVRRIFDQFAPHSVKIVEAYGDTRGDREMLHAAEASFFQPFRVTPISD